MRPLIGADGILRPGLYDDPVSEVNYLDYPLETSMGTALPRPLRRLLANQFHFAGIIGPDIMAGLAVVDLKFLANAFVYVYETKSRQLTENKKLSLSGSWVSIRPTPENPLSVFNGKDLKIQLSAGSLLVKAPEITMDLRLDTRGLNPLRLLTRAGYRGWVYMQKTTPIALEGQISVQGRNYTVASPAAYAITDWTTGYMRRDTCWNWAVTATTLPDGRPFGLNLSCGVNETSYTENAFWVAGHMTKVDMTGYRFNQDNLLEPWHITSFDRKVDLIFHPEARRGEHVNALLIKSRFTQLMGHFSGTLRTDTGEVIELKDCPGWTEDHYARW